MTARDPGTPAPLDLKSLEAKIGELSVKVETCISHLADLLYKSAPVVEKGLEVAAPLAEAAAITAAEHGAL